MATVSNAKVPVPTTASQMPTGSNLKVPAPTPTTESEMEMEEEIPGEGMCECDPCVCETPIPSPSRGPSTTGFQQFNSEKFINLHEFDLTEYIKAKEYFSTPSRKSGLVLYDHVAEILRKLYNEKPNNPADFFEEISYNIKRYKFRLAPDQINSLTHIPKNLLTDAEGLMAMWQKHELWSVAEAATMKEQKYAVTGYGGFPNQMKFLFYLEQIHIGLAKEEMFKIGLALRQHIVTHPVTRARFWGKIFGSKKNYYIIEAELSGPNDEDLWIPTPEEEVAVVLPAPSILPIEPSTTGYGYQFLDASGTLEKAGAAVTDPDTLRPYALTSGLPQKLPLEEEEEEIPGEEIIPNPDSSKEIAKWEQYKSELMSGFPKAPTITTVEVPPEITGVGLNRRVFYVCNNLAENWTLLPNTTPQEINGTRKSPWLLTGNLNAKITTHPVFAGYEGNYLRALLARITAGAQVSPKGYYRLRKPSEYEDEDEDEEEEEEEEGEDEEDKPLTDLVYPSRRYKPDSIKDLLAPDLELWVHHATCILRQGRTQWWNPLKAKLDEEFDGEDDDEEEEGEGAEDAGMRREIGPPLFTPISADKTVLEDIKPWSVRGSPTIYTDFQVASVRSNLWPGASAICTTKGKFANIYIGDGNKFVGHSYAPDVPQKVLIEYKEGPELIEVGDPTVQQELDWIALLKRQTAEEEEESGEGSEEESIEGEEMSDEEESEPDDDDV